jgi:serine kinase of HPr protein (carbohydrate metabolism regulator)
VSTTLANMTCVAIGGRAVLIEGAPGSGKSSLALALIDRGAVLVGDDGVTLNERGGRLWASPPPNIAGFIEVRNVGLVTLPTTSAPLALAIRLDEAAPRHIDAADTVDRAGHAIPAVFLYPRSSILALRAEFALKAHGLA